jgi:hypothetical protein
MTTNNPTAAHRPAPTACSAVDGHPGPAPRVGGGKCLTVFPCCCGAYALLGGEQ